MKKILLISYHISIDYQILYQVYIYSSIRISKEVSYFRVTIALLQRIKKTCTSIIDIFLCILFLKKKISDDL